MIYDRSYINISRYRESYRRTLIKSKSIIALLFDMENLVSFLILALICAICWAVTWLTLFREIPK